MLKKTLHKFSALALAAVMLAATGCSGGNGGGSSEKEASISEAASQSEDVSEEETGEPAATGEGTEFEWFLTASALPQAWDMSQPIFKEITEKTGMIPKVTIPAADADTKLNLMISAGTLPDMITLTNADLLYELIDADLVWDFGELMETYVPDSHIFTDFPEDIKKALEYRDGGWYSYPSHMVSDGATDIWGYPEPLKDYYSVIKYDDQFSIFISSEYADQLDIDVKAVNTEDKLFEVMGKFHEAGLKNSSDADVFTVVMPVETLDDVSMRPLQYQFGTLPYDKEGNYRSVYYADEYRHAVEFLNKCFRAGYLDESVLTMDNTTMGTVCNSGRAAIFIGGIAGLNMGHDSEWRTPGPVLSSTGAKSTFPLSAKVSTGWLQTLVSKSSKEPEKLAEFIDYMSSEEGMLLHMYGIEGDDYTWDDEEMLHRTESGNDKVEDSVSGMYGFYAFHHTSFSRSVEYVDLSETSDLRTALGSSDKSFKYDSSLFTIPSGYIEADSEYAFIKNEVITYVNSNLAKIMMAPDDETFNSMYDDFVGSLDDMGLRKYDEFVNISVQEKCKEDGVDLKQEQP